MEKESGKSQRQRKNDQSSLSPSTDVDPPEVTSSSKWEAL